MKLTYVLLAGVLTLASCQSNHTPAGYPPSSKEYLINPGEGVGAITIGENKTTVQTTLQEPRSERETNKRSSIASWYQPEDSTKILMSILFSSEDSTGNITKKVKRILVTDTLFRTKEGVGTGELLIDIARVFIVRPIDTFRHNLLKYTTYGTRQGMTFVINPKGLCDAVIIHSTKESDTLVYQPFY